MSAQATAQPVDCKVTEASGFTEPAATVDVAAREPGIVARMLVEPGDRVEAGDVLAELDKTVLRAEVESARAQATATGRLDVARARLDHARHRMDEMAKLRESGAARPLELITVEAELEVAEAELQAAEDERRVAELTLAGAEARLALLDVRAPFDGVVEKIHRDEAELVGAGGDSRVLTLYRLDRLHADFYVPASCIGPIGRGAAVIVTLPRLERQLNASVRNLGLEFDAPTGLRRISLEIDNSDYALLGGERLSLALPVGGLER